MTSPTGNNYQLFIRDFAGDLTAEITDYSQFDCVLRHRNVGSWSIKLPSGKVADALRAPGAGIVFERNGVVEMSGPNSLDESRWESDAGEAIVSGLTDDLWLWDVLAFPCPADWSVSSRKVFGASEYDVRTGVCETVLKAYVAANSRRAPDQAPLTIAPDLARGTTVTGRARFQFLGDLLIELALVGGNLGFQVKDNIFEVTEATDLRKSQVFSADSGNLQAATTKITGPTVTDAIAAGSGEGTQRLFVRSRDILREQKYNRHIERLIDKRDVTTDDELMQAGDEALLDGAELASVDLRVLDVKHRAYGTDWKLGDLVTVQDIPAQVREVKITLDANGETVLPVVDSASTLSAASLLTFFDRIRRLQRRVNALERKL